DASARPVRRCARTSRLTESPAETGRLPGRPSPSGPLRRGRVELQGAGVPAIALPRRTRPVREDMAQMAATAPAPDLGADHPVAAVLEQLDVLGHRRLIEARPPRSRLELGVRAKQLRAAAGAAVGAVVLEVDVLPGEGALGGGVAQDLELIGAQSFAPLLLGEAHVSVCVHGLMLVGLPL